MLKQIKRTCGWILCCVSFLATPVHALSDLDYLPKDISYDPAIPLPAEVLGAPVGSWHVRHDQLVNYMRLLAERSPRISLVETGRTHENRPLLLLAFTSASNQKNLLSLQQKHAQEVNSAKTADSASPLVLWMGYSVHGDEPSGSNASLLVAYYLAAAQGEHIDKLLAQSVILLDPSINPDGLARFAQWANMHKSLNLVGDPNSREHQQGWPSARTNHYWFDLNRDWLLLTHPESQARIRQFNYWRPHVLTDFHEMGSNSTFFFQPGISSRKNPWTPEQNVTLTAKLAEFHAQALDDNKQLYFTQESYDDFYYGKGSTYPDAVGSIGILFEQASSRGHLQDTIHGPLSFEQTIQNQVTTSLSTFAGALASKTALLSYPAEFTRQTDELIKEDKEAGYLLSEKYDQSKFAALKSILEQHEIEYWSLTKDVDLEEKHFDALYSIFVPLDQGKYRLIKSLFSTRTSFNDNTFYDVSNWNLALAFNIEYRPVIKSLWKKLPISKEPSTASQQQQVKLRDNAYAYAFSWQDSEAPKLLQRLLDNKVQVKIAGAPFVAKSAKAEITFPAGSILIPMALAQPAELLAILDKQSADLAVPIWPIDSGLTKQGIDLGSRKILPLEKPKVLLVGGRGTSQYEVGEAWHYLDQQVGMAITIAEKNKLDNIDFSPYTHMIWVEGNYADVGESVVSKLQSWLSNGGVLIGQKSASKWFSDKGWLKASFVKSDEIEQAFIDNKLTYADKEAQQAKQEIAGAVFAANLDLSHPLAFGYTHADIAMFRNSTLVMHKPVKPFITLALYHEKPLLAGYTAPELQEFIGDSAAAVAHKYGKGKVIAFTDDLNFRGYWRGTSRLLSNAIFMAGFVDGQG
jgi:hypothetical protein